ncbi:MAG: oligosaccharide flippase family protein [Achromobacter sp.]|uniref:Uncharacterized protein n=1 Tax=Achromobacter insuavis TaxID=1287735 RepID=A0A6J5A6N9_9BURK|nr:MULTISPECIES: oligosaccharide flippase family protein [Achromobacter]MBN9641328.1 oligosaccharide flippase family protein [Achromobacter sp.]CAB3637548.1 hypothetical protein LMG26845_01839 [Achromobacter insuavis]CUJ05638.1 colanic acid exporter [Achromobacter sp. 2789STDY5608633]CUJ17205.1 colanic acid exporter [Achromobacter sp. 2789STDY5608621]CUJ61698.1 colanic acid exporter [Achromobacter sp. 2789STDY5608628]
MNFRSVSIYLVFNVLSAVVPIMALPILTRYLTPEDYGLFTIFTIVSMFAGNAFRLELNMALKREYVEAPQKFSPYVSSATVFSTFMMVPYALVVLLLWPFFDRFYGIPWHWLFLIVLLVYFRFNSMVLHHLWQITNRALPFGIWALTSNILSYGLAILFIFAVGADWRARAWGEWIAAMVAFPVAIYYLRKQYQLRWSFDPALMKKMLRFSLPLLPSGLMSYVFMVSDRMFIAEFSGAHELGLYSVALQLAAAAGLVFSAVLPAWESWVFTSLGPIDGRAIRRIGLRLLGIFAGMCVLVLILPGILGFMMPYLTSKDFAPAQVFLFPCLLATACTGMFNMISAVLIFMRKTVAIAYINAGMVIFNFVCLYIFVSKWGAAGAAYGLALTFTIGSAVLLCCIIRFRKRQALQAESLT